MFLAPKTKGLVIDIGEQTIQVGVVSNAQRPYVIEQWHELDAVNEEAFVTFVEGFRPTKTTAYVKAVCSFSPPGRFIRRTLLDAKRIKEPDYLSEVAATQFRIEVKENKIAVLNAFDGHEFDPQAATPVRDVVFAGMLESEASAQQARLLQQGVYPERLELASLSAVGALVDYLRFSDNTKPTLMLEMGVETTHSYIVSNRGLEATRLIQVGLEAMIPVVQKELGLKDDESARKLFYSNTFDFTGMGAVLCRRLLKELQSSMGFFEVQTGQSIGQLVCTVLPGKLAWLETVLAAQIGVSLLAQEYEPWLTSRGVSIGTEVKQNGISARNLSVLGLLLSPAATSSHAEAVKK